MFRGVSITKGGSYDIVIIASNIKSKPEKRKEKKHNLDKGPMLLV